MSVKDQFIQWVGGLNAEKREEIEFEAGDFLSEVLEENGGDQYIINQNLQNALEEAENHLLLALEIIRNA